MLLNAGIAFRNKVLVISFGISVNVSPPSVLTCHWKVVPFEITEKVALSPSHVELLTGWFVITGSAATDKVEFIEVTAPGQSDPVTFT